MKAILFIGCLAVSVLTSAQKKEAFYDYYWKPCEVSKATYYSITQRTDSGWQSYLQETVRWPDGYKLENTDHVTVGVEFCINEEGKITDVTMYVPFDPVFDKAAMDIIRRSPACIITEK